jgi:hypothetical protein
MRFGAHIFGVGELADPQTLVEVAQLAEDLGYHSIFVADHFIVPRGLESKFKVTSRFSPIRATRGTFDTSRGIGDRLSRDARRLCVDDVGFLQALVELP